MAKQFAVYTVRNAQGQFLGTYRASSADAAIRAHQNGQAVYFSTFRSHAPRRAVQVYTAKVEG